MGILGRSNCCPLRRLQARTMGAPPKLAPIFISGLRNCPLGQERMKAVNTETKPRRRSTLLLIALSLPVLAILLTLGTWQVQRLQWKEGLIQRVNERMAEQPVPLAKIASEYAAGEEIEYRPVTLSGSFLHQGERHYFATWQGQSGYFVHTPMDLGGGQYILVNRGFVPFDRKDPVTREAGQVEGRVDIGGVSRLPET